MLYHIGGISIAMSGLPNGLTLTFPPLNWPPAPGAVLRAWTELEAINKPADCLHCAPAVIEDLFEYITHTPEKDYSPLAKLKILQPGGAALSQVLLEKLVALGCNVKTTYGSTEIGPPWRTMPHTRDNPHCYRVRNLFPENQYLEMQPLGDGVFEPVVYKGFPLAAELWELPDSPNPYRTNDLFIEDPPHSGLFVLQGRKDDLLVHTNGEKTNALPLQMALDACPDIQKAAVFGHGRPCASAVIKPTTSGGTRSVNKASILASVERCCRAFATHSRIDPSMIHILRPDQIIPVTPKGSVRRKEAERLYEADLDAMYKKLENGGVPDSADKDLAHLSDDVYTRYCARQALGLADISFDASFYSLGLDSQKAVRMRSALMKRFGKFPLMFIFEYCSVLMLSQSLASLGGRDVTDRATAQHHRWIQDAIARYSVEIRSWPAMPPPTGHQSGREIVYLTGATGSLGNAMLEAFISNPAIEMVYCAIRGGAQRLAESLRQRGYPASVCESDKLRVVPYDMSAPGLGLNKKEYSELAAQVTTVLHNAWKLDFNQPVNEFDHDCLQGTIHLMRFANTGKQKRFAFSSSVATHLGSSAAGKQVAEAEIANDPSLALDTGYAQSKVVVEMLCQTLTRHLGMHVAVFRIGQLCGHSVSGAWNETEMFPLMITSGAQMKAMPVLDQKVDWLPVDVCARSISLLLTSGPAVSEHIPGARCSVNNLVNPAVISWKEFLDVLDQASNTTFERVPMPEWVARLQSLSEQNADVPGAKLLGFFEDMARDEGSPGPSFSTAFTQRVVPEFGSAVPIDVPLMRSYLSRWKR
ncbi:hypothetical protein LTR85_010980 [Meristemomyces frigidus]|nr:hypothetical protein LTR85_010980 [Meristemomyces frigidus]